MGTEVAMSRVPDLVAAIEPGDLEPQGAR